MTRKEKGAAAGTATPLKAENEQPTSSAPGATAQGWRALIPIHPAAKLLPRMSASELRDLADDINANGVRNAIVLWTDTVGGGDWQVLDGVSRLDALELNGGKITLTKSEKYEHLWCEGKILSTVTLYPLTYKHRKRLEVAPVADPYDYAVSMNLQRRHLTGEQKHEFIANLLRARHEQSNRQIAETAKADHKTVGAVRDELERRGEIPHTEQRTDRSGRRQPANKPAPAAKPGASSRPTAAPASPPPQPETAGAVHSEQRVRATPRGYEEMFDDRAALQARVSELEAEVTRLRAAAKLAAASPDVSWLKTAAPRTIARTLERELDRETLYKVIASLGKPELALDELIRVEANRRVNELSLPAYRQQLEETRKLLERRKGHIKRDIFRKILACCSPNSLRSDGEQDERTLTPALLSEAFQAFKKLELVLVAEDELPTKGLMPPPLPATVEELKKCKEEKQAADKAKRAAAKAAKSLSAAASEPDVKILEGEEAHDGECTASLERQKGEKLPKFKPCATFAEAVEFIRQSPKRRGWIHQAREGEMRIVAEVGRFQKAWTQKDSEAEAKSLREYLDGLAATKAAKKQPAIDPLELPEILRRHPNNETKH
jgi:hypothetical protein